MRGLHAGKTRPQCDLWSVWWDVKPCSVVTVVAVCECSEFDDILCNDRIWSQFERSAIVSVKRKKDLSSRNSSDLIDSRARWDNAGVSWRYMWWSTVVWIMIHCSWWSVLQWLGVWMWGGSMQGLWSTTAAEVCCCDCMCGCEVEVCKDYDPCIPSLEAFKHALKTELFRRSYGNAHYRQPGLPLTGVRAYYTPENLAKTPKIRWPGVRVRPK